MVALGGGQFRMSEVPPVSRERCTEENRDPRHVQPISTSSGRDCGKVTPVILHGTVSPETRMKGVVFGHTLWCCSRNREKETCFTE
jgi:hypothetical protein